MAAPHYPDIDRSVLAVAKAFAGGTSTGWHSHERAQLIFAVEGLMVAHTDYGTWVVPSGYAFWVPAGVGHDVRMHGAVAMRTAYFDATKLSPLPRDCFVLKVSSLLEALLVAMCAEPPAYDEAGRGGHLAALVLDEIGRAPPTPFALAVPRDPRLARLVRRLIGEPGAALTIDGWADAIGVSRRTLTRLFRQQTGLSFGAWRRRLRLLEAMARQAAGEPLPRVAASLGYGNVAAFRTMARRELGTALDPRQPRR